MFYHVILRFDDTVLIVALEVDNSGTVPDVQDFMPVCSVQRLVRRMRIYCGAG